MSDEKAIELLKKIEKEVNTTRRVNQNILTALLTILATITIFAFLILSNFPDPTIAIILVILPLIIGVYKIMSKSQ